MLSFACGEHFLDVHVLFHKFSKLPCKQMCCDQLGELMFNFSSAASEVLLYASLVTVMEETQWWRDSLRT